MTDRHTDKHNYYNNKALNCFWTFPSIETRKTAINLLFPALVSQNSTEGVPKTSEGSPDRAREAIVRKCKLIFDLEGFVFIFLLNQVHQASQCSDTNLSMSTFRAETIWILYYLEHRKIHINNCDNSLQLSEVVNMPKLDQETFVQVIQVRDKINIIIKN